MAVKTYNAGVKEYRQAYWMPEYTPLDTDILACFKITPQAGVPREEVAAAVAAESSTGTWTTVWTDLLTDLDYYKGRASCARPSRSRHRPRSALAAPVGVSASAAQRSGAV